MDSTNKLFFQLIQVAIGNRTTLTSNPSPDEWQTIYELCRKQSLIGIGYCGLEKLPKEQWPPRLVLLKWVGQANKLKERNIALNGWCKDVCTKFDEDGFWTAVLKGQSNLMYYPQQIGLYRTSGDIDLWVLPTEDVRSRNFNKSVSAVISYVRKNVTNTKYVFYHHADFPVFKNVEIEVHYRPSWMSSLIKNRWFQKYAFDNAHLETDTSLGFPVATVEFNIVYQLIHIYRHLFTEGIGLRQLLDYYFVMTAYAESEQISYQRNNKHYNALEVISKLGMKKFCSAVMHVMKEVFNMPDHFLLCQPNKRDGEFLLQEIMLAGNFGHFDQRYTLTREESPIRWGIMKLRRNMKFLSSYPEEVIWEPIFRIYHFAWRVKHKR